MSATTKIEWTDRTWNPVRGCSMARGSENGACLNCYAARQAARNLPAMRSPSTGKPFAVMRESGPRWTGDVELIGSVLVAPMGWRKPQRIFVNSMSDLFHEALTDVAIDHVFAVMAIKRQLTFQVLTKRPERMRSYLAGEGVAARIGELAQQLAMASSAQFSVPRDIKAYPVGPSAEFGYRWFIPWPLPNVWLGVSVENQTTADERIPLLLQTPAAVRFVSYEPALGRVDFRHLAPCDDFHTDALDTPDPTRRLDWVIVGGESGPGARDFDLDWARATVAQCREAGVACFVKQVGARPFEPRCQQCAGSGYDPAGRTSGICFECDGAGCLHLKLTNKKGGNPDEWPADLRVREFPAGRS